MGYRTLEINKPAELHIRKGQLEITQEEGSACLALEDLESIVLAGPDIRISSNALAALADACVMVVVCGSKQLPSGFLMASKPNTRQNLYARKQIALSTELKDLLWQRIVMKKIENQSRVLSILGKEGVAEIAAYAATVQPGDPDNCEATAAGIYFPSLHEGLNRRTDDPFNSVLNYGYAILRSTIVKGIISTGFITCLGVHHDNQLNAFNLADDLIESFRPMVDIVAPQIVSTTAWLSKEQRRALVGVLHHACQLNTSTTTVMKAIARTIDSFRRAVESVDPDKLVLPTVIAPRFVEEVVE